MRCHISLWDCGQTQPLTSKEASLNSSLNQRLQPGLGLQKEKSERVVEHQSAPELKLYHQSTKWSTLLPYVTHTSQDSLCAWKRRKKERKWRHHVAQIVIFVSLGDRNHDIWVKHLVTQPGTAPKIRPSHLTTADAVNKVSLKDSPSKTAKDGSVRGCRPWIETQHLSSSSWLDKVGGDTQRHGYWQTSCWNMELINIYSILAFIFLMVQTEIYADCSFDFW